MRKMLGILLSVLLLLGALPVAAAPVADLTAPADRLPEDVATYIGVRTDDAYFETLNSIAARLPMTPEGFDIREQLGIDFENSVRPWLGDTAGIAIGVSAPDAETGQVATNVYGVLSVTDREAAQVFVSTITTDSHTSSEVDGGTLYEAATPAGDHFLLLDDVLLAGTGEATLTWLQQGVSASLADRDDFAPRFDGLPADDYNALLWVDAPALAPQIAQEEAALPGSFSFDVIEVAEALGTQAAGFTILDDRSLTADIAVNIADPAALEALGVDIGGNPELDLGFAANIPADTPLVLHDAGLGTALLNALDSLEALGDSYDEQYEQGEIFDQNLTTINDGVTFVRLAVQGMTGASLEEVVGWMSGDYALFLTPSVMGDEVGGEGGIIVDVTDETAAMTFIETWLPNLLTELNLDFTTEDGTLVLPILGNILENPAYDILAGANDDLLAIGTRPAAAFALGDDEGLSQDATFTAVAEYIVEAPQAIAYLNVAPLESTVAALAEMSGDNDLEQLAALLPLLESGVISANYDDTGAGTVRMVLTLSD